MGDGGKGEAFQLTQEQQWLIREDCMNQKLWDEVLASLKEGPVCLLHAYFSMFTFSLDSYEKS